ncbi:MAG TPA: zf-HC2 domain-containing protein [Thermoanaerobaculia bacterium]|jgi:anti-sigma factor RsiW|nr:zf-HC2 domain-containing protein [Thermoanaerobaculia bacterium]
MNCQEAIERLPWWLNGSLEPAERREVEAHLAGCASCRQALEETRLAWEVFAEHVPTEALVAYADDERPPGLDPDLFERHLADCPQCAAELEMARASRLLSEHGEVPLVVPRQAAPQRQPRRERGWQAAALAAGLTGVIAMGGLWTSTQRVHQLEAQRASAPVLRGVHTGTSGEAAGQQATAVSTSYYDFSPVTRGESVAARPIPAGAGYATLILHPSAADTAREHTFQIRNGLGRVVQGESALLRNPDNFYSVLLPLQSLPPGDYVIETYGTDGGAHQRLDRFPFTVQ